MTTRLPLSSAQREIWFDARTDGDRPVGQCHVVSGPLDIDRLRRDIASVVDGTATLRTRVHPDGSCEITPPTGVEVTVRDLSGLPDPRAAADTWMADRMGTPIDPDTRPLCEQALLRLSADTCVWFQRYHRIAVDRLSMEVIARRVAARHADPATRCPQPPLAALLLAEARYRQSTAHDTDRAHWLSRLTPDAGRRSSPTHPDHRPPLRYAVDLDPATIAGLSAVATRAGTPLARALLAGIAAHRHLSTGRREATLVIPVTARTDRQFRAVPAVTANHLPLRTVVEPGFAPVTLTQHVAARMRALLAHQRYRGVDLARELGVSGGLSAFGPVVDIRPGSPDLVVGDRPALVREFPDHHVDDLSIAIRGSRLEFAAHPDSYSEVGLARRARELTWFLDRFATAGSIGSIDPTRVPDSRESAVNVESIIPRQAPPGERQSTGERQSASMGRQPASVGRTVQSIRPDRAVEI